MNPFADLSRQIKARPGDAETPEKRAMPEPLILPGVPNPWGLTPMQCEVLRRVVLGDTAKGIAAALGRSHRTMEVHYAQIRSRMRVSNMLLAAMEWTRFKRENDGGTT